MSINKILLPQEIYADNLHLIKGVKFSQREIEVITCILHVRTAKKMAALLSIAPKTIESHIRNITQKLECNSREGIVDFIEKSDKYLEIKSYYSYLLVLKKFEEILVELSKQISLKALSYVISLDEKGTKSFFLPLLKKHLSLVGLEEFSISSKLFSENTKPFEISINSSPSDSYYLYFFHLLETIFPYLDVSSYRSIFKEYCEKLLDFHTPPHHPDRVEGSEQKEQRSQKLGRVSLFGILTLVLIGLVYFMYMPQQAPPVIRSDLIIPADSSLLNRPELISQLTEKLENQKGIQTVAIVGPGGAGKTTLARHYAHQEKANVIWEINAESLETLTFSFENLAQALAKSPEDQKTVKELGELKNLTEKLENILKFVKARLKSCSNWILLYDNVERFSDIQKYFPQDFKTWGQGKVIVTTRDSTIENNKHINEEIQIGEFTLDQKLKLFSKIRNQREMSSFTPSQIEETKAFLDRLPPFPLDVSVAAYYLNVVNVSFKDYLENMSRYSEHFTMVQENLLREAGDYTKTRYGIMTLSLQKLLDTHKDFAALLLFISLLDSQNIPTELIFRYKDADTVNNFIYHLKKYSLITEKESSSSFSSTISFHRSTQSIILAHLTKEFNLRTNPQILQSFIDTLETYIDEAIGTDAFEKMKGLVNHVETFSKHNNLLTESQRGSLETELGYIYISLGNYIKALQLLEKAQTRLKKNSSANYSKIAQNLVGQGNIHAMNCKNEEAKKFLEEGLLIYRKHAPENESGIAFTLLSLGNLNRWLGNYKEAASLLEEVLVIYANQKSPNYMGKVMGLAYLGHVYDKLGEYKKAISILKKDLKFCTQHLTSKSFRLGWVLLFLGRAYQNVGYYKKARELIEKSVFIYRLHLPENHILIAANLISVGKAYIDFEEYKKAEDLLEQACLGYIKQNSAIRHIMFTTASIYLGKTYYEQGNYQKAETFLKQALATFEKHYGKEHIETAQLLNELGQLYRLEGQLDKSEDILQTSLKILESNNHPQSYATLESLSELYVKKASFLKNEKNLNTYSSLKTKAQGALKKALQIAKANFPPDSSHIKRLQERLKTL